MMNRKLWRAICAALLCAALLCGTFAVAEDDIILEIDAAANAAEDDLDLELDDNLDAFIEDVGDIELDGGALTLDANLLSAEPEAVEVLIDPASNDGETEGEPTEAVPLSFTYNGPALTKVYDLNRNVFKRDATTGKYSYLITAPKATDFQVNESELIPGHTDVQINLASIKKHELFPNPDVGSYTLTWTFGLKGDDAEYYTPQPVSFPAEITPREVVITPRVGLSKVYGTKDPVYKDGERVTVKASSGKVVIDQDISGLPGYAVPSSVENILYIALEAGDPTKVFPGWLTRETGENVGTYKILIGDMKFSSNFSPQTLKDEVFTITPKDIGESNVTVDKIADQEYTGKAIKPALTVRYGTMTLEKGKDYTVEYFDNTEAGTAKVKLTGKGNFKGTKETTFTIIKKDEGGGDIVCTPKGTSLSKVTGGKRRITVKWKKGKHITGYQIAFSRTPDFKRWEDRIVKNKKKTSLTIKGLRHKKVYYVRIRTYKRLNGQNHYSAWSKAKKVRTK